MHQDNMKEYSEKKLLINYQYTMAEKSNKMIETEIQKETDRLMNIKFTINKLSKDQETLLETNKQLTSDNEILVNTIENNNKVKEELDNKLLELMDKERELTLNSGKKAKMIKEEAELMYQQATELQEKVNKDMASLDKREIQVSAKEATLNEKDKEVKNLTKNIEKDNLMIKKLIKESNEKNDELTKKMESIAKNEEEVNMRALENKKWEQSLKQREEEIGLKFNENQLLLDELNGKTIALQDYESNIEKKWQKLDKFIILFHELQTWLITTVGNKSVTDAIIKEMNKHLKDKYWLDVKLND